MMWFVFIFIYDKIEKYHFQTNNRIRFKSLNKKSKTAFHAAVFLYFPNGSTWPIKLVKNPPRVRCVTFEIYTRILRNVSITHSSDVFGSTGNGRVRIRKIKNRFRLLFSYISAGER